MDFDTLINIIKADLGSSIETGEVMLFGLFPLAILFTLIAVFSNKASWSSLIARVLIGIAMIQSYTWIMDTTRDLVTGVNEKIIPAQDFIAQYQQIVENFRTYYENNQQKGFLNQFKEFGKNSITNLVINLSFIFYGIASYVMNTVRFIIAGFLYKIGPALIPFILFRSTGKVIAGWYTSYVSVLLWPIIWQITLAIAVAISANIVETGDGLMNFISINFAVSAMVIFAPMVVTALAAGYGVGAVASFAGALATTKAFETLRQGMKVGISGGGGAITAAGTKMLDTSGITRTGTPGSRFVNLMGHGLGASAAFVGGGIKGAATRAGYRYSENENKFFNSFKNIGRGKEFNK
jgi:hypothetical protein